ncbi:MAG: dihydroorotate dehydrogenase [Candidatus Bipolaricaulia bacterium]
MARRLGFEIEPPITNASGPESETYERLIRIARSSVGAVITKSMTHCPRTGNPEPRLKHLDRDLGSLNSMGLPNLGYRAYAEMMSDLKGFGKPVIASIATAPCSHGLSPVEQYGEIAEALTESGADLLELNLSCPNLEAIPIAMDPQSVREMLEAVKTRVTVPISVKLPPYNNVPWIFEAVADVLIDLGVECVSTMNSEPNTMEIDLETMTQAIRPRQGYGGLGGRAVLPIALAEVHRCYTYFRQQDYDMLIFGVGGITEPEDAIKHHLAGADIVQIGTAYLTQGPEVFERIAVGVERWLEAHDFRNVSEIVGTVRDL